MPAAGPEFNARVSASASALHSRVSVRTEPYALESAADVNLVFCGSPYEPRTCLEGEKAVLAPLLLALLGGEVVAEVFGDAGGSEGAMVFKRAADDSSLKLPATIHAAVPGWPAYRRISL